MEVKVCIVTDFLIYLLLVSKPLQKFMLKLFLKPGMKLPRSAPLKWKMRTGIKINTIKTF